MKIVIASISLTFLLIILVFDSLAQNTTDTRLLTQPAISENNIAFIYAEDLWVADKDGSNPKRLTIDEGVESNPVFSPDGTMIAFSAEYDGNIDVFIVAASGGIPKRLTWHPGSDIVQDFSSDGEHVAFLSQRSVHTTRFAELFTISTGGGMVQELPIPTIYNASFSDDGAYIAYNPANNAFSQWKHYRGGRQSRIWIFDQNTNEVEEIPKPETGSNDTDAQWVNNTIYFRSDRNGEFNIYSFDRDTDGLSQLTNYDDFGVMNLKSSGSEIIYEQAGYLHILNTESNISRKLTIGIATDLLEKRSRFVSGSNYIRSGTVSPSGARAVFDFRGEIVTVPEKNGDPQNLTNSPGIHEKFPVWSPDSKYIAYFSDASGEYALHIYDRTVNTAREIELNGNGFYSGIEWSPNSEYVAFVDNGRVLYVTEIASGNTTEVARDMYYRPGIFRDLFGSWSHDSNWITYTIVNDAQFEQAFVYNLDEKRSFQLSDGLSDVSDPVFDPSGKYIYMLASTDAGPIINWFDQSNQDMQYSNNIFMVVLQQDTKNPLGKENDREKLTESDEDESENSDVIIDWNDIENRIISLPVSNGQYSLLRSPSEGKIYYLSAAPYISAMPPTIWASYSTPANLKMFDIDSREEKDLLTTNWYQLTANGEKILHRNGNNWGITSAANPSSQDLLNTEAIEVKIDPVAEWENIFNEAWRVNRDYFYDPGMHGADWDFMYDKYEVFLQDVTTRADLYRMMQWMFSEIAVGHHRFGSRGDRMTDPERVPGGLLGADFEVENNRYKIARIYGGLNWTPDLRSPLTEPGVNVTEGDYIIMVNGENITSDQNFYSFFENTSGKTIELIVSTYADGRNSRTLEVVPISNEISLRNRFWIEENIKKVHEATGDRVAYVYVPNTRTAGHEYFKRYFFPQADMDAIIVDERYNGGGQLADYYIDILKKPYQASWNFRYGQDLKAPSASIQGPKIMLIDENAGSGGDYLPYLFRRFNLGTLIGKRTWGGLVGVLGFPEFIDGGSVTAPNVAFYNEDGFGIENVGVYPDIEVEYLPKYVIEGRDPQLERAIDEILEDLEEYDKSYPERPEYPVRVKN